MLGGGTMLKKDASGNIEVTRGDFLPLKVSTKDAKTGQPYVFHVGEVLRFTITERKECGEVLLEKYVTVTEEGETVPIIIPADDMKIGELINKPTIYWFEVELNPETSPQTIIGYDEDGAKLFTIYPEGSDKNE